MNEKNFDYLKDQVKFTGFGEGLENELKEKMQKQTPEFQLNHQSSFGKDETAATLYFKKSDQSDMYFFNKYDLTLKQDQNPEAMKQTFYLNKESNITLKEAYNLMNGRAVNKDLTNKEGKIYNAWVQLDMKDTDKNGNYKIKQFHQNYGFDLEKALSKLPIKELTNEQEKTALMNSLQKGNRQAVTFNTNGSEQRQFIEANPQFKSITIYDSNMQRVNTQREKKSSEQSIKQDVKKESQKQDDMAESNPKSAHKRTKRKGLSIS